MACTVEANSIKEKERGAKNLNIKCTPKVVIIYKNIEKLLSYR
jgi:hypothetical protein